MIPYPITCYCSIWIIVFILFYILFVTSFSLQICSYVFTVDSWSVPSSWLGFLIFSCLPMSPCLLECSIGLVSLVQSMIHALIPRGNGSLLDCSCRQCFHPPQYRAFWGCNQFHWFLFHMFYINSSFFSYLFDDILQSHIKCLLMDRLFRA